MVAITEAVALERNGEIGLLWVDNPPVNALGQPVRQGLADGVARVEKNDDIKAMIIICRGRTFCAGADIRELGKKMLEPFLPEVLNSIDRCTKPIVAALHGTALGGGFETALSCHYRIAVSTARIGLPEVKLGLLPAAGGTQRLPRLIGPEKALRMILSGDPVDAIAAFKDGVIDEVAEGDLATAAVAFAHKILTENRPLVRVSAMTEKLQAARGNPGLFDEYRKRAARDQRGYAAPQACINAVEAAVLRPFAEGCAYERELFYRLREGAQSTAQRYYFFAERQAAKVSGIPRGTPSLDIEKAGIAGAGDTAAGLAMGIIEAGIAVTIVDPEKSNLHQALDVIRSNYHAKAEKGDFNDEDVKRRMALVTASSSLEDLAAADLIIESAGGDLTVRKAVMARLDDIRKETAILATNTAYLDLDEIAAESKRPESILGMHFLSPVDKNRLLEIVRTPKTSSTVLSTALLLAKKIGKIGVVVCACPGLAANRTYAAFALEATQLLLEGALPTQVDRVMYEFGFPRGPFARYDWIGSAHNWEGVAFDRDKIRDYLCQHDRFGANAGKGYYNYDKGEKDPKPAPEVDRLIVAYTEENGYRRREISDQEILNRCIYAIINTGARLLEENIVLRPSDLDVIWVNSFGWPVYWGGPMFYADHIGLDEVLDGRARFAPVQDEDSAPSSLLENLAKVGKTFNSLNS